MTSLYVSLGIGLALAAALAASPLGVLFLAVAPLLCVVAGRGLDAADRRLLVGVLGVALGARLLAVLALFVAGIPEHSDLAVGALRGDEAYNLGRALRTRDIMLGLAGTHYDYFVTTDEYGRTSYLALLTYLQLAFGPAPYGLRLMNALLFTAGAALLFRIVRPAFGRLPAFAGLVLVLFLPSVFYASISLLKESLYFLATSTLLAAVVVAWRSRAWRGTASAVAVATASLWVLDDLRRGAIVLAMSGIGCALVLWLIAGHRRRVIGAVLGLVVIFGAVTVIPSVRERILAGVSTAAKMHSGHVFTVGHAYKLLDTGFYVNPTTPMASSISLTPPQAARFVLRAMASFVVTPLPWQAVSLSELAFLPEHMLWYVIVALLPVGVMAAWRRDALVAAVLLGFVLPTAVVLALTNGNIGTLLRLRGLVTPYLAWISVLGAITLAEAVATGAAGARRKTGMKGTVA